LDWVILLRLLVSCEFLVLGTQRNYGDDHDRLTGDSGSNDLTVNLVL